MQLTQLTNQLEAEKKRGEALNRMRKAGQAEHWWEAPIEGLGLQQLEQLKGSLEELKKNVAKQADRLLIQNSNPPQFFGAGNSNHGVIPFDTTIPYDTKNVGFSGNAMLHTYNHGYGRGFY